MDHLPEQYKADVKRKLQNAYALVDYSEAKRALEKLHRELMDLNPSAARSLEEGLEETLTVHLVCQGLNSPTGKRRMPSGYLQTPGFWRGSFRLLLWLLGH